jgi:hypothetical protein
MSGYLSGNEAPESGACEELRKFFTHEKIP